MKLIGKGAFTKAYLLPDGQTVKLVTNDPCKECMAIGLGSDSPLFPKIEQDGWEGDCRAYKMKFYPRVSSLKKALKAEHYELYKFLRNASFHPFFSGAQGIIDAIEKAFAGKFSEEKQAIAEHINGLRNYGEDIRFEISPRNVAVENGKLILLDCFFFESVLFETRNKKKRFV
jgi:hypothetical protein